MIGLHIILLLGRKGSHFLCTGRGGYDRMVVGFTTTCVISGYQHESCEFESRSWRGVLDKILSDKVCQ
jgi:hypothetical protein